MPTGYSLHIGVNIANEIHYGKDLPQLKAAVNDALFWESYARSQGYRTQSLHDKAATVDAVKQILNLYSKNMKAGDILLLTYAGHGGQITNDRPISLDSEGYDQTWCLYDRQMLDDEIYECFESFVEGTRILVVSDSCHSGTITRDEEIDLSKLFAEGMAMAAETRGLRSRQLPMSVLRFALNYSGKVYQPLQEKYKIKPKVSGIKAAVKLLAACQDDQQTLDGPENGIFTAALKQILNNPLYQDKPCEELLKAVSEMYFFPNPNFFQYGSIIPSFDRHFPFQIDIPEADKISGYRNPEMAQIRPTIKTSQPWTSETAEIKTPAVLVVEMENSLHNPFIGGGEVIILEEKNQNGKQIYTLELPSVPYQQGWSVAHALQTTLRKRDIIAFVEPVISANPESGNNITTREALRESGYMPHWPPAIEETIGWHLDENHSQLAQAREEVQKKVGDLPVIRIAQIDTGYVLNHPGQPKYLNFDLARSFVNGENRNQALDAKGGGDGQDGHGLGTVTILAGKKAKLPSPVFRPGEMETEIGAIPFAEVIPIRISDSVAILNTENFCEAVRHAIEAECEVITMSMGGKPSLKMARAVNEAYEAGIVMVTAAGNNWFKGIKSLLPKCVLFPAAFPRVIAATGAMYNQRPYDKEFMVKSREDTDMSRHMQGSWGPPSRMTKALAAYSPNILWADNSFLQPFVRNGAGTSCATPQVAASAALWIAYHKEELKAKGYYNPGQQWKKVEAVRYALYRSAAKESAFPDWKKYYGNGIVRAFDALKVDVPDDSLLQKSPDAESSYLGLIETVETFFLNRPLFRAKKEGPQSAALAMELLHLLQTDPQFYDLFSELDLSDKKTVEAMVDSDVFRQQVRDSRYASDYLKSSMTD
ncbi:MAG: S8 family serine peptidase [Bacteroidia bacterium]|nr:S8 family serine peptidase [Bacteroidia bacterium]